MADSERVAELKRKMLEAAQRAKAETAAAETPAPAAAPVPAAAPAAPAPAAPAASAPAVAAPSAAAAATAVAESDAATEIGSVLVKDATAPAAARVAPGQADPAQAAVAQAVTDDLPDPATTNVQSAPTGTVAVSASNGNGAYSASANGAGALEGATYTPQVLTPEELVKRDMNRREFLTYAWGGALLLVTGATGVGMFQFLYPRFKAGEFGGKFMLGPVTSEPATDAPPQAFVLGKFWLVNTKDEGIKALYMVCPHLGCLYKWEPSTVRFECPCHGSMYTREGFYIRGPAPRSLDRFVTSDVNGELVVDTGSKILGSPAADSPANAANAA